MYKYLLLALFFTAIPAHAGIVQNFNNVQPFTTNLYDNGTSTNVWNRGFFRFASTTAISGTTFCISTDCRTAWPSVGSGAVGTSSQETSGRVPFWTSTNGTPALLSGGVAGFTWNNTDTRLTATYASSTALSATNANFSLSSSTNASSTLQTIGTLWINTLTSSGLGIDANHQVYAAPTTTAGTGLTYNSGANTFTVNTTQNITNLSNLTTNGFVITSGGNGTLGVQQFPATLAQGGTNATSFAGNSIITSNAAGTALIATTSDPLTLSSFLATSTSHNSGIGTSTPWAKFSINPVNTDTGPMFAIGSTTGGTKFLVESDGDVSVGSTTSYSEFSVNAPANQDSFVVGSSTGSWLTITHIGTTSIRKLDVTGVATSSFGAGINLSTGCFSINNVCVGAAGATPGGTATELQYRSGASTFGAITSVYNATLSAVGIGTTTLTAFPPTLTLATSTKYGALLNLSGGAGVAGIGVYNQSGQLIFASTSEITGATTSNSTMIAVAANGAACFGIGCTAPTISGLVVRDQEGTGPMLYQGGNANGDTDWLFRRYADNDATNDDRYSFGVGTIAGVHTYEMLTLGANSNIGIGTTTPQWPLTISSSTKPQLTLTDGSGTNAPFNFRTVGGNFYLTTSTRARKLMKLDTKDILEEG